MSPASEVILDMARQAIVALYVDDDDDRAHSLALHICALIIDDPAVLGDGGGIDVPEVPTRPFARIVNVSGPCAWCGVRLDAGSECMWSWESGAMCDECAWIEHRRYTAAMLARMKADR